MVPSSYTGYFAATVTAAGTLIGLLFVAISVRPESVFGEGATDRGQALAGSAFTGLVNAFFLGLTALIPGTNVGIAAMVIALVGVVSNLRWRRREGTGRLGRALFYLTVLAFLGQLAAGAELTIHPHDTQQVGNIASVVIALMAFSLARAWFLMQGRHVAKRPE